MLGEVWANLQRMRVRQIMHQIIAFGLIVSSALMIWKTLMVATGSESPIVVVLSGSMEPTFHRGDLVFLYMSESPIRVGEVVVFKLDGRDIPIVHRVLNVHERPNGEFDLLTKGDNNRVDDRSGGIYPSGQMWLNERHIIGRARGFLPYVVTIIMTEYPYLKFLLIGVLGLFVLSNRE